MMKLWMRFCMVLALGLFLFACNSGGEEEAATPVATEVAEEEGAAVTDTPEPEPTDTPEPEPTDTPEPTDEPEPTDTPEPTESSEPTAVLTDTPAPEPEPTDTPSRPTLTPTPDKSKPEATAAAAPEATASTTEGGDDPEMTDALQLVIQAEERSQRLETITISQLLSVSVPGLLEQIIDQTCVMQLPDDAYCTMVVTVTFAGGEPVESFVETVTMGEQNWVREEGGEWQELPPDALEQQGLSREGLEQLQLSQFMLEAELVGETMIDGVPVHEIAFTLDVNSYFASILGEEAAELFTQGAEENSGSGTIWIGQEDNLSHKATIEMSFLIEGEMMTVTTQAAYTGHDEPVEIPDPTAE